MSLFFSGLATGALLTIYIFLRAYRTQRTDENDCVAKHADRWNNQHPWRPY
jgi:hypothetical protein